MKMDLVRRRRRTTRLYLFEMLAKGKKTHRIQRASATAPPQPKLRTKLHTKAKRGRSVVMGCCREGQKYKSSK
jgi:hypothetical protein